MKRALIIISIGLLSMYSLAAIMAEDGESEATGTRAEPERDGVITAGEYSGSQIIEDDIFEVYWTVDNDRIYIGLRAKTTGWLSLGLDPDDGMSGADMIFGWVDTFGDAFMKDAYATDNAGSHPEDTTLGGADDLESYDGAESGGWTTIEFRRDLNTGDSYDKTISTVSATDIIWSIGSSDDWNTYHSSRGDDRITFTEGAPPPPPPGSDLDGIIDSQEYDDMTSFDSGNFELHWTIDGAEITAGIRAQTTGWISIGIGYTSQMQDSDMIFGWVDSSGTPGVADTYSTGPTGPHPADETLGGSFDIISYNATESGGWTTLEFRRLLSTGDTYDNDIVNGSVMNILWGVSSSDDINSMHTGVGYSTWDLTTEEEPPGPSEEFDGIITTDEYGNSTKFDSDRFEIHWEITGTEILIGLRAETTGYITIGIDPSTMMKDADVIIGGSASGTAYISDEYSTGNTGPHSADESLGGSYDIVSFNATESGGWTTLEFRRSLDTGDTYDNAIPGSGEVPVIWAVGSSDNTGSAHSRRGSGTWNLSGTPPPPPPPPQHESDLDGIITTEEYGNTTLFDSDRFELHWKVIGTEILVGLRAQAAGWISLGIDPTSRMDEADMIVGWIDGDGIPRISDMYSTGPIGPHPPDTSQGGTDDILDHNSTRSGGWTTVEFRRELDTGDSYDKPISGTMTVIWAVSDSNDPSSGHTRRGTGTWQLEDDEPQPQPEEPSSLDGIISEGEYDDTSSFGSGELVVHWKINGTKMQMALDGDTTGWVSIGFEPTTMMKDADMIFGWVESGDSFALDTFSTGNLGPHPPDTDLGGTDDILDHNGTESGGRTVFEFIRELDTGDSYDKVFPENGSVNILWAIGDSDNYLDTHSSRGTGTLLINMEVPDPSDEFDGTIDPSEYEGSATFHFDNFRVFWRFNGDEVDFGISARTEGWISLGLDPQDRMQDSDVFLGWVDNDGEVHLVDAYATGPLGPHPPDTHMGGTNDILRYNGSQINGTTTIEFSRKLTTDDEYDKPVPTTGEMRIMWAYSPSDDFSDSHSDFGYAILTFGPVDNNGEEPDLDGLISTGEYEFNGSFGDGGLVEVHWKVEGENIRIALVGKTTGWVSIGIDYSQAMADSDMIFGWVEDDGSVSIVDAYSTGPTGPHPSDTDQGGTFDILSYGGKEINGITTIEFIRKLDTGDDLDNPIPGNGTVKIIWAIGDSDSFNSMHTRVGYGTINIETGETTSEDPLVLWPIHAFFMTLGVGGMVAATVVLYNKKRWRWFFKFHMWVMTGSSISAAIGLISGFIMVEQSTGQHMRVLHSWLGLLTLLVVFSALGIGFYFKYTKKVEHKKMSRKIHLYAGWAGVVMFMITAISGFIQALFL